MLGIAQKKELLRRHPELRDEDTAAVSADAEKIPDILYLQQDMRSFELYGTVRAVVSVCDSVNYILEEETDFPTVEWTLFSDHSLRYINF